MRERNLLHELADLLPRGAILESSLLFEDSVRDFGGIPYEPRSQRHQSPISIFGRWSEANRVPKELVAIISDLRVLRNEAAHVTEESLSPGAAHEYVDAMQRISATIDFLELTKQ